MIYFDGVVYRLQSSGGISVLFDELMARLPSGSYFNDIPQLRNKFSRYFDVRLKFSSEVFHSTYYRLPEGSGVKVVSTVHDFTYERYSSGPRKWVHSWQKKRAVAGSDKIICVSENTKNDLLELYGKSFEEKIVVIHNGVSSCYCELPDAVVSEQVLFVGGRGGYKNFSSVVHALEALVDINLICVGGGGFSREEIELMDKLIPGRYHHAGFLSNDQLNVEYNKSICLLYPSLYEGFGIPVLEAMRAGCPVVAVNASSIPEVAGSAAFMLERGQVDEIKEAIEFLCVTDNRSIYRKLGFQQAYKFSWDLTFEKTVAVYEELLGRKLVEKV